jgi:hypothetical protein
MSALTEDTRRVREEFDAISRPTQIFIAALVALGVIIGVLLGALIGYGIAVEEVEGRQCIEHQDTLYCAEGTAQQ